MQLSRVAMDVNTPATHIVEDRPGRRYVYRLLNQLLDSGTRVYARSVAPFRVYWILTRKWGIDEREAMASVKWLVESIEVEYIGLAREWIAESLNPAEELRHGIHDCSHLALAPMAKAGAIVATGRDFEALAPDRKSVV